MTNMPIVSPPSQSNGNVANTAQTNGMADIKSTEGMLRNGGSRAGVGNSTQPSADGGLSNLGAPLAEATAPFAALLAKQIGEIDSTSTKVEPGTLAIDGAASASIDEQDQTAIAASTPNDQTNTLAAMLLQLPQEMRTPITKEAAGTSTDSKKAAGIDISARLSASRTDARLEVANTAQGNADATPFAAGKRNDVDTASQNAVKELIANQNAFRDQPVQNNTQSIASSAISPALSNMLTSNRSVDSTQTVATPLGNSGWADDFSQKISWMSTQKNQVAELHLNPPDLGPLNVVLKISDNQATALFTSPHSAVREALENAIPRLREILADNGISLGNTTVSDQPPRDRGTEEFMKQGSSSTSQHGIFGDTSESSVASSTETQDKPVRRHNGMVDTFA